MHNISDYISRETLIGKVQKHYCTPCKGQDGDLGGDWCRFCAINGVLEEIRGISAADVEPVKHGRWGKKQGGFWEFAACSLCGEKTPTVGITPAYCPNCGAKMDLEG